jgi:hypothetical protein
MSTKNVPSLLILRFLPLVLGVLLSFQALKNFGVL